jgi:hypothetical protein
MKTNDRTATEFAASVAAGYSIYSTLNSSPWTAESFGGDPEKARSCLFYSKLATITNVALGLFTSLISRSVWPLTGFAIVSIEMDFLYRRAVAKAQRSGSSTWDAGAPAPTASPLRRGRAR